VEQFLFQLERVPWFERLGRPVDSGAGVDSIADWEDWQGPGAPGTLGIALRQQALHDELFASAGERGAEAKQLWDRIHAIVFRDATPRVPYKPDEDCYHAPSQAVWDAAWTAGLVGICLLLNRPIPAELAEQWKWYLAGRWPCAWHGDFPHGRLVIY
jgi:hypothetical protein